MGSLPRARRHLIPSWAADPTAIPSNWSLVWAAGLFTAANRWEVAFAPSGLPHLLWEAGATLFWGVAEGFALYLILRLKWTTRKFKLGSSYQFVNGRWWWYRSPHLMNSRVWTPPRVLSVRRASPAPRSCKRGQATGSARICAGVASTVKLR